jgi:hypothetical protein
MFSWLSFVVPTPTLTSVSGSRSDVMRFEGIKGLFERGGKIVRRGAAVLAGVVAVSASPAGSETWRTDFDIRSVDLGDIMSGGPSKDGIPAIDAPTFIAVEAADHLADNEPVIGLIIEGDARAYPLQVLMWHEIVNDSVGGVPVSVTYCPLCNAAVVFDRRVEGRVLDFGTTGRLRHSDLVMYDLQTESWWQQFLGEAIVGELTGTRLRTIPARLESFSRFRRRAPDGKVLVPGGPGLRRYGSNPYVRYDSAARPFLYRGEMPPGVAPLSRVVTVSRADGGKTAWTLAFLRDRRRIETDDGLVLTWEPGQSSALDTEAIASGIDVGNVVVQRRSGTDLIDVAYGVDFAFAFHAFHPDRPIIDR